jgi:hypothetical protein
MEETVSSRGNEVYSRTEEEETGGFAVGRTRAASTDGARDGARHAR